MNMGTDFLPCLRRAKDPNDWYFGFFRQLIRTDIVAELRVIFGWRCLIKVDAVLALYKSGCVFITSWKTNHSRASKTTYLSNLKGIHGSFGAPS